MTTTQQPPKELMEKLAKEAIKTWVGYKIDDELYWESLQPSEKNRALVYVHAVLSSPALAAYFDEQLVEGLAKWFYKQDHHDQTHDDGTTTKWAAWRFNLPVVMERYRTQARAALAAAREKR